MPSRSEQDHQPSKTTPPPTVTSPVTDGMPDRAPLVSATTVQRARLDPSSMRPNDVQHLQRTIGNHAVVETLGVRPTIQAKQEPIIQRKIVIDPTAYASGLGVANLSKRQLAAYFDIAVLDDLRYAKKLLSKDEAKLLQDQVVAIQQEQDAATRDGLMAKLVQDINTAIDTYGGVVEQENTAKDSTDYVTMPNRRTRYATTPEEGYQNTSFATNKAETLWGSDEKMREQFGQQVGGDVFGGNLTTTTARGKKALPLQQLTWDKAKQILPRSLLNLLFDVRFQLETGGATVIDERTPYEQSRKVKSPSAPGTLRSWHQDEPQVLPDNGYGALPDDGMGGKTVAVAHPHAQGLHTHYNTASQSGAGSSVSSNPAKSAQGYAEYTGTGSDWEHNTKIVLDYLQKRVYLTLTHYQYWALIDEGSGSYTFWESGTQDVEAAQGKLDKEKPEANAILMSPWMEVLVT